MKSRLQMKSRLFAASAALGFATFTSFATGATSISMAAPDTRSDVRFAGEQSSISAAVTGTDTRAQVVSMAAPDTRADGRLMGTAHAAAQRAEVKNMESSSIPPISMSAPDTRLDLHTRR